MGPNVTIIRGVFQGNPISAMVFIIYFAKLVEHYELNLDEEIKRKRPLLTTRNKKAEYAWTHQMEIARFREKRERKIKKLVLLESWTQETANDSHIYADDLAIKTTQINEIYPKRETFQMISKKFQININWVKIKIIVGEHEYGTYATRKKLPSKYRVIQFASHIKICCIHGYKTLLGTI